MTPLLVLNVNDEEARRYLIGHRLREVGFRVVEAASGAEALAVAERHRPDAVLLDVRLPDVDGLEVCRRLRSTPATAWTPIVLLSAYFVDGEAAARGLACGADAYLAEPLDGRVLDATVRAAIRARGAEQEARAAEARQRFLFDALPSPAWVFDAASLRFLAANDAAVKRLGYRREQLLEMTILDIRAPEERERAAEVACRQAGDMTGEWRLQAADGEPVDVDLVVRPMTFEGRDARLVVAQDITAARRIAAELEDASRLTRAITDNATLPLFLMDARQHCVFMNPAAERLTGYRLDQVQGRPLHDVIHHTRPDGRPYPMAECPIDCALPQNARQQGEDVFLHADGHFYPVAYTASPILEHGRPVGTIIEVQDISTRKQAEAERLDLLAREQGARAQAEAANRTKDEFLAMLAHELRNPMAAITSAIGVLDRVDAGSSTAASARTIIRRQADQLRRLVDDLLDVARVTTGKVRLALEPVDLAGAVQRSLGTLAAAGRVDHHVVDVHTEPVWVDADPARLDQVVINLVTNAVKYTPPGGTIRVRAEARGDDAVVEVADTGIGIAPELLPRIFELFTQGEQGLDGASAGLGIGLTLVRSLVEQHRGTIEARSDGPGLGSAFTVRLPRIEPTSAGRP